MFPEFSPGAIQGLANCYKLSNLNFLKIPLFGLCKTHTYFFLEKFPSTRATQRDPVDLSHYLLVYKLVRIYLAIEK